MRIACGFDHAGFPLKEHVLEVLRGEGHEVARPGHPLHRPGRLPRRGAWPWGARSSTAGPTAGVVVCGSGAGVAIAATKMDGIRAAVVHDTYTAHQAVEHDDMNVLCLGARVIGPALSADILRAYAGASFTGEERHVRRLGKIDELERTRGREA